MSKLDIAVGFSWHKKGLFLLIVIFTAILMLAFKAPIASYGVLIVMSVVLWYLDNQSIELCHIAESDDDKLWQFLVNTHRGKQLWQGSITHMTDCPYYVVLSAQIVEPKACDMTWTIFKDSMDTASFRRLKVLSRFY